MAALTTWERAPRLDDVLRPGFRAWTAGLGGDLSSPLADIRDEGAHLVLTMDVPGVSSADLDIQIEPRRLTVRGARRRGGVARVFDQSWTLACTVDSDRATASLEDGVLTVVLPKIAPRRIELRPASGASDPSGTSGTSGTSERPGLLARMRAWFRELFGASP